MGILRNSSSCSDMVGLKGELGVHTRSANQDQSVPETPDAPKHNAHDETDHCGCIQLENQLKRVTRKTTTVNVRAAFYNNVSIFSSSLVEQGKKQWLRLIRFHVKKQSFTAM